ncbi:peptidase M28 [Brochothrix thermosphacta]|uniref:M42 family metallopeptidase n=1 Tax=Brochothrix thermosphacta TaxID=2756 RepID=UPI000E72E171|nr:M42 family metallopeptidase [Brochothrix thermosphacta]ANZ97084.1 peptidase M28 [Brochothrix thermosphacta]
MNNNTQQLFKTLTEMAAPSGFERPVRAFMKEQMAPNVDRFEQDGLGGLFGVKENAGAPRILVAGHMDEVGFIVTKITPNGMIKFDTLGGWSPHVLSAQRVQIVSDHGPVIGVIASVPPHLLSEAERNAPVKAANLLIDIGADSADEVMESFGILPGYPIAPVSEFTPMANPKKILAKAWDNRYGVGLAIEAAEELKNIKLPHELYIGATVQEEVGLRGAEAAASMIKPEMFIALDASPANDTTGDKSQFGQLGGGFLLRIYDRTMITHRGLRDFMLETAKDNHIPYQYFVSPGGTDAGTVHKMEGGIPSAVIGLPSRYIHTSQSILHVDDYAAAKEMLLKLLPQLDATTIASIKENA